MSKLIFFRKLFLGSISIITVPILLGTLLLAVMSWSTFKNQILPVTGSLSRQSTTSSITDSLSSETYLPLVSNTTDDSHPNPTVEPTPTITTDPTVAWTEYTDAKYGYSFKYPPNWFVKPASTQGDGGVTQIWSWPGFQEIGNGSESVDPSQIVIEIYASDNLQQMSVRDWWSTQNSSEALKNSQLYPVQAGSNMALMTEWRFGSRRGLDVMLSGGKRIYTFSVQPADSEHLETFNMLLSTFRIPAEQ